MQGAWMQEPERFLLWRTAQSSRWVRKDMPKPCRKRKSCTLKQRRKRSPCSRKPNRILRVRIRRTRRAHRLCRLRRTAEPQRLHRSRNPRMQRQSDKPLSCQRKIMKRSCVLCRRKRGMRIQRERSLLPTLC